MDSKSSKSLSSSGLPMARVKIIMKSSPDVDHISPDALFAMTKATVRYVCMLINYNYASNLSIALQLQLKKYSSLFCEEMWQVLL